MVVPAYTGITSDMLHLNYIKYWHNWDKIIVNNGKLEKENFSESYFQNYKNLISQHPSAG